MEGIKVFFGSILLMVFIVALVYIVSYSVPWGKIGQKYEAVGNTIQKNIRDGQVRDYFIQDSLKQIARDMLHDQKGR